MLQTPLQKRHTHRLGHELIRVIAEHLKKYLTEVNQHPSRHSAKCSSSYPFVQALSQPQEGHNKQRHLMPPERIVKGKKSSHNDDNTRGIMDIFKWVYTILTMAA